MRLFAALVVVGTAARVVWAFASFGIPFDIRLWQTVADVPLGDVYELRKFFYPPGFLPFAELADAIADRTSLPFHALVQLPAIAADAGLAVLVFVVLRARCGERAALVGGALVALGPSFAVISGYHGQLDSLAILPAAAGCALWVAGVPRRALWAGLLIGLGASVKPIPLFCVLALLPAVRGRREAVTLVVAAVAVPLVALAPWLLADAATTIDALTENHGVPGFLGLSTLVQPELTRWWIELDGPVPDANPALRFLADAQNFIVVAAALAVAALRRRPEWAALALVWLTVSVFNVNFAYQYAVWVLPFLLLAGLLVEAAVLQAVLIVPNLLLYFRPDAFDSGWLYWVLAAVAWGVMIAVWWRELSRQRARAAPCSR